MSIAKNRLDGLDTLRALAIVLVFMYHYMVFVSSEPTFGWLSTVGWVGVDLFFVLSGYLIGNQLFSGIAQGKQLSLKAFYARRFLRTLPNFYVVLALYFLFPALMGGNTPPPLWRFLSFTQNLWLQPGTAFSHAWSLCIEEQFYLLLPPLVLLWLRWGKSVIWAWLFLVMLILLGVVIRSVLWLSYGRELDGNIMAYHPNIYYSSFCRFDEFVPGVALAMLKNFHRPAWDRLLQHGWLNFMLAVIALSLVVYFQLNNYYIDGYGYGYAMTGFGYSLTALAFGLLTLAALSPSSPLYRLRIPGAASLAAWSYAIYLTHKAIGVIALRWLKAYGVLNTGLQVLIVTSLCVLGGWLLYRLVETPFMNWRDRHLPSNFPKSNESIQVVHA